MKFKYLFLSFMLLIMIGSITAIAADDDYGSLGDYTFDLPDGYEIVNKTDNMLSMQQDTDHAVVMSIPDEVKQADEFKADLEAQGYEFGDEDKYICDDGNNSPILITLVIPADEDAPDSQDNPVTTIINSLE